MQYKKCFALTLVASTLLLPGLCHAKSPAKQVKAQPKTAKAAGPAHAPEYGVRVIYFIPKNRKPEPDSVRKIREYTKLAQKFFSLEMARYGFYKAGTKEGKTFICDTNKNGEPYVHIIRGRQNDDYYAKAIYGNVPDEIFKYHFSNKNSVILVFTQCENLHEDGTFTGGAMGGTSMLREGKLGGYAIIGGDTIWMLDRSMWTDKRKYDGMVLPWFGKYPLKFGVSYPGFQGETVGSNSGIYFGAITHELGHGFDLPHCFCADNFSTQGDLMGNGCRAFTNKFSGDPKHGTGMCEWDIDLIATSRFFNPEPRTDFNPPIEKNDVVIENPCTPDVSIHCKLEAKDKESGLFCNVPSLLLPGTSFASIKYDKSGKADVRVTAKQIPVTGLSPKSYILFLRPIDMQGNRNEYQVWLSIPETIDQQYRDDSGNWVSVGPSNVAANGNLRLVTSLSAFEDVTELTPEIEIQPVGKAFTGKANYTGSTVLYDKKAAQVTVPVRLAPGKYHWRYRIKSNNPYYTYSSWVNFKSADNNETDFEVSPIPSIVSQSKSQTRCLGQKMVLSVDTVGAQPISYQWKKNGTPMPGATSAEYVINAVSKADAGRYECSINNSAGSITAKPVDVSVVEGTPLAITSQPVSQKVKWVWGKNVAVGKPITASHAFDYNPAKAAVDGDTDWQSRWCTYNCPSDSPDETVEIDLQGTYPINSINAYFYDDDSGVRLPASCEYYYKTPSGDWKLITTNSALKGSFMYGAETNTIAFDTIQATAIKLVIKKGPLQKGVVGVGLKEIEVLSGTVGEKVTLSVSATGSGPISYQWRKDGVDIPGATQANYVISTAMPVYAGVYDCVVKNAWEELITSPAKLDVDSGQKAKKFSKF